MEKRKIAGSLLLFCICLLNIVFFVTICSQPGKVSQAQTDARDAAESPSAAPPPSVLYAGCLLRCSS